MQLNILQHTEQLSPPHKKSYLAPNVNSVIAEKHWSRETTHKKTIEMYNKQKMEQFHLG